MKTNIGDSVVELVEGDIAEQDTDAVVTAAHWKLHGGDGTDGAIHSKGGPSILEECRRIGSCPIGGAVITGAGRLKARYVIHAVGPIYSDDDKYDADLLSSAYRESLRVTQAHGLKSVSFPSISTGAFGYPMHLAAPVAMRAICEFLTMEQHGIQLVRMVLFPEDASNAYETYKKALGRALAGEK